MSEPTPEKPKKRRRRRRRRHKPTVAEAAPTEEALGADPPSRSTGQQRRGKQGRRKEGRQPRGSNEQPPSAPTTVVELLREADRAFKSRKLVAALKAYAQVLELDPGNVEAQLGLGRGYNRANDSKLAIHHFESVLDQSPSHAGALDGAAVALLQSRRYDEAKSYALRLGGSLVPRDQLRAKDLLAQIAYDEADFERAQVALDECFDIADAHPEAARQVRMRPIRYLAAQVALERNRPREAIPHLRALLRVRGRRMSISIADQLARVYLEVDRAADAIDLFKRVLEQRPNDIRALVGLGRAHLHREDPHAAADAFKRALEIDDRELTALEGMVDALREQGELDGAARYVERISRLYRLPEAQRERRLRALDRERARREAELFRVRNIASLNLMATGIAHELRQPLSVIRLAAQNAQEDLKRGDTSELSADLADIDLNIDKIDRIIRTLRHIAAETGLQPKPLNLSEVVNNALVLFRTQLRNREIDLRLENLDHQVLADEGGLEQILVVLVSNARDALAGTEQPYIKISAVSGPRSNRVSVLVIDNGAGMTPSTQRSAFDPFFTTKSGKGTGLGLYIAHNLARKMGGRLEIKRSQPGKGTRIELILKKVGEES